MESSYGIGTNTSPWKSLQVHKTSSFQSTRRDIKLLSRSRTVSIIRIKDLWTPPSRCPNLLESLCRTWGRRGVWRP